MASSTVVVEMRRIATGPLWVLSLLIAGVLTGLSVVVGVVASTSLGVAVPLHNILIKDPHTQEVLVEFDPPALKGKQVLALMRKQALQLDRAEFLRRWSSDESRMQELLSARMKRPQLLSAVPLAVRQSRQG